MRIVLLICLAALIAGCGTEPAKVQPPGVRAVSSHADLVTGGDMLLSGLPEGVLLAVNGDVVSQELRGDYTLVTGLPVGAHELVGTLDKREVLRYRFTNYPAEGPVISGPHQIPFFCETEAFEVGPGAGKLGPSDSPGCRVDRRFDGFITSADGGYITSGDRQPEVVVETGVINRAIFQVAMPASWNGKLIYAFGGGCRGGWYRQGSSTGGVLQAPLLSRGFALASASLNVFGVNCNDLLAAETMMMVKEHFIEQYGPPAFTIGYGCSGGSYQGHQIGDNYPGLLDGILVGCSFPEVGHAMVSVLVDSRLLKRYFDWAAATGAMAWTSAEQRAVTGLASDAALLALSDGAARVVSEFQEDWPSAEFAPVVPVNARFDPVANRSGARPTLFDHTVNVYGRDPATGYARWPLDNQGVQYGLQAYRSGLISATQFVHLNEHIGGLDRNGGFVSARIAHDEAATRAAYQSGRILDGGAGLNEIPIIDYRAWVDGRAGGDTHLEYHTYSTRARLLAANGNIDNHVVLTEDGLCEGCSLFSLDSPVLSGALDALDAWLVAIRSDRDPGSQADRIRRNRPQTLTDACWIDGEKQIEPQQMAGGRCNEAFPTYTYPRYIAGAPIANNIIACTRRPLEASDLEGLSVDLQSRMGKLFADGVCDWGQPGRGQVGLESTWWRVAVNELP
ncbi:MAG: DUF6351 family protein [Pseudomonadota bacterium]